MSHAADRSAPPSPTSARRRNPLWWIVFAAFALQLAAWAVWFSIARQHPVTEVPLEIPRAR